MKAPCLTLFCTTTTHKTLRGPRGGMILCKEQYAKEIDKAVFPGIQGGPLMHVIAAKAICLKEALSAEFRDYAHRVVKNAQALAAAFKENEINMVSGGTDNHLILLDLRSAGITGKELEARLGCANITVNKNAIPFDPEKPFVTSGIRVGTPAVTSRGFDEDDMRLIAGYIARIIREGYPAAISVRAEVEKLAVKHPLYDGAVLY